MSADSPATHVPAAALEAAVAAILGAAGASAANAAAVAANLVEADGVGRASHGTRLLGSYVDRLLSGAQPGAAVPEVKRDDGVILRIDGKRAFGQVVGAFATGHGIARAKQHGVALVAIENASHFGRNAKWPELAAQQGVASIHFGHGFGTAPSVVPFGGTDPKLRTSPIALGAPAADGNHVILDFSVAELSMNSVKLFAEKGERLPAGSAILADGALTDDPTAVLDGLAGLLPFGGFKGYGLAIFAEIFAGAIAGGAATGPGVNIMLSIYIDVARVTDMATYTERLTALLAGVRSSTPRPGAAVSIPGDRSRQARQRSLADGIPFGATAQKGLRAAADRAGLSPAIRAQWPAIFPAH